MASENYLDTAEVGKIIAKSQFVCGIEIDIICKICLQLHKNIHRLNDHLAGVRKEALLYIMAFAYNNALP